jgi:hypothetical protein
MCVPSIKSSQALAYARQADHQAERIASTRSAARNDAVVLIAAGIWTPATVRLRGWTR